MKKTLSVLVLAAMLVLTLGFVAAGAPFCGDEKCNGGEKCDSCALDCGECVPSCTEGSGSIWTTRNDCGEESQDVNQYALGDKVFINGDNFCAGDYNWAVTGQPGGASGDPASIVASGIKTVDSSGAFCFEAYTVAMDDWGTYTVDFGKKNDNYRVDLNAPVVPEFGTTVGILTALGALGAFFLVRRR